MIDPVDRVQLVTLHMRVLLYLASHQVVSQEKLARQLDVTMRTVQRHLTELEEEGYITVDRSGRPFRYTVDWAHSWPSVEWLQLVIFHPEVHAALASLSEMAIQVYGAALARDLDPAQALNAVFAGDMAAWRSTVPGPVRAGR